ncbi:MAG: transcription-repair coupling factor [Spirochaetota bacterium]
MKNLVELYAKKISQSQFVKTYRKDKKFQFYGVPQSALSFLAASIFGASKEQSVISISPTNSEAEFLYRESLSFLPAEVCFYFPGPEGIPYDYSNVGPETRKDRINVLSTLLNDEKGIIFTSSSGFLRSVPKPSILQGKTIHLRKGQEISPQEVIRKLISEGYKREEICEQYGRFSVKGGIIDVYPSSTEPFRLDFFGDCIDEIKNFDPGTQRSLAPVEEILLLPSDEFILSEEEKAKYYKKLDSFPQSLKRPEHEFGDEIVEELIPLIRKPTGLLSYFRKEPVVIYNQQQDVLARAEQIQREYTTLYEKRKEEIICVPPNVLLSLDKELHFLQTVAGVQRKLVTSSLVKENELDLQIRSVDSFKGKIRDVRSKIKNLHAEREANILLTSSFPAQTERLTSLFSEFHMNAIREKAEEPFLFELPLQKQSLHLALSELRNGFVLQEEGIHIWSDNDIFGRAYKRKSRFKRKSSKIIDSFIDLKEGDFVVHANHGVGKFVKIEKVTANEKTRDFLKLEYSGGDTLFVPLDQISLVQRYIGGSDRPTLDTLGKNLWKKKKERVQESVDKLAEELVIMYSNRMKLQGFAYPKDSIWQEEFEAEFEYEETPDQLAAIEAVKLDLESSRPMDRLVCGDVGYGKTEVAIRSAFKVIMAGRQVIFIAPTTILALQHYNTLKSRFQNYPIKLEMVSRFRTAKENKDAIKDFNSGELDLLVGTHALLTGNTKAKKLGLLIIDEEQRFGVNHKEAIKKIKNLVDVLTLTATPIPRTLHMSLTGIRDLSIIETPPRNRQSVETFVMEDNDDIMIAAIQKEIDRGGQVFYLYNRVETIEEEAKALEELLPNISIGVLHGQLTEEEVEETLIDFNKKKYDLLVTTTIIESGIDMPNVNTIIVRRADRFGLSQLYQIRGRVGRSGRKAHAYLFFPAGKVLTEQAEKRLNTIHEYQELGSGFKVAMRDLEIRGAGNLLGKEQSGDIMEVGFDLYVQMLNEAVSRLKGEVVEIETRASVNFATSFHLPDQYIPDTRQKVEFYKKFESCLTEEEVESVAKEMQDRFGIIPADAAVFILLEKIRTLASQIGFDSVLEKDKEICFKSGANFKGEPAKIIALISQGPNPYIKPGEPAVLRYKPYSEKEDEKLQEVLALIQKLL